MHNVCAGAFLGRCPDGRSTDRWRQSEVALLRRLSVSICPTPILQAVSLTAIYDTIGATRCLYPDILVMSLGFHVVQRLHDCWIWTFLISIT